MWLRFAGSEPAVGSCSPGLCLVLAVFEKFVAVVRANFQSSHAISSEVIFQLTKAVQSSFNTQQLGR